jgi:hypothetical protein
LRSELKEKLIIALTAFVGVEGTLGPAPVLGKEGTGIFSIITFCSPNTCCTGTWVVTSTTTGAFTGRTVVGYNTDPPPVPVGTTSVTGVIEGHGFVVIITLSSSEVGAVEVGMDRITSEHGVITSPPGTITGLGLGLGHAFKQGISTITMSSIGFIFFIGSGIGFGGVGKGVGHRLTQEEEGKTAGTITVSLEFPTASGAGLTFSATGST